MKKNIQILLIIFILLSVNFINITAMKNSSELSKSYIIYSTNINNPPYPASNPNPINNSINIDLEINLSWTGGDPDPEDIVTYNIFFGTNSNPPNVENVYPLNEYNPGKLEYNTQYYWRIDSYDEINAATTGPTWTFTTKEDNPPYIPSNPFPLNESIDVDIFTNLSWAGGDPDGDNVTYDVYFGNISNPPNVISNYDNLSYSLGVLDYNTQYFWRIDAWDEYGYSSTSSTWTFTTKENPPPIIPYNIIPENDSTNIYIDAILSWIGGDPDGDNVTYDVYLGIDQNPIKVSSNQTDNFYDPEEMETTTTYYWKIITWDSYGLKSISPLWHFKTSIYTNSPPEKPNKPSGPTTGRPGISYSYSSYTTEPNGEPIFYMFDWDDSTRMEWIGPFNSGQTVTVSHTWRDKGSYAIKVKAKDIYGGESFWSDPLAISMPKIKIFNNNLFNFNQKNINLFYIINAIVNKII
jgi:hypothetical protein